MSDVPVSVWVQWEETTTKVKTKECQDVDDLIEAAFKSRALKAAGLREDMQVELFRHGESRDGGDAPLKKSTVLASDLGETENTALELRLKPGVQQRANLVGPDVPATGGAAQAGGAGAFAISSHSCSRHVRTRREVLGLG